MDTIFILMVVVVITGLILSLILDDNALPCLSTLIIVCVICCVFISVNASKIPGQASRPIEVATPAKHKEKTKTSISKITLPKAALTEKNSLLILVF